MRITFDFHENELKMSQYLTDRLAEIAQKMGPRQIAKRPRTGLYTIKITRQRIPAVARSWGPIPKPSALNRYLQSWDVPNLFVMGGTAFPQNAGYNPTHTICALAYWAADAIINQYQKNPGPLASGYCGFRSAAV